MAASSLARELAPRPVRDDKMTAGCTSFRVGEAGWTADTTHGPVGARCGRFLVLDVVALAVAAAVACVSSPLSFAAAVTMHGPALAVAGAAIVAILAACCGYRSTGRAILHPAPVRAAVVVAAALAAVAVARLAPGALSAAELRVVLVFLAAALALVPLLASAYRALLVQPPLEERVVLVGSGPLAEALAFGIAQHRHLGLRLAGHVTDAPGASAHALGPRLGGTRDLTNLLREFDIARVVLAGAPIDAATEELLLDTKLGGLPVDSGVAFFEGLYERMPIDARLGVLLESQGFVPGPGFAFAKRALDLALAASGLVLLAPVLAVAALAIKLSSPGPVLYGQIRLGRGGQRFRLWKLRSMHVGAERGRGAVCAESGDPRVTAVGRFLRRSRLDEVPQLWNVLRGDMSVVGPRPERPELFESLVERYPMFRYRTAVRPGLTGWAQVRQGYVSQVDGFGVKLSYDLFYLKNRSLALDLRVLWHTAGELVRLKGV